MADSEVSAHGYNMLIEMDPVASPGVFTEVPGANFDFNIGSTRPEDNVTPHNATTYDDFVLGQNVRDAFPFTLNYNATSTVHQKLKEHYHNKVKFGMAIVGPQGTINVSDYVIWSGGLSMWREVGPVRSGARRAESSFRPTGPWIVDTDVFNT